MSVTKNDSRRYEWHLYLKGLTKEVTPKLWMKPAMICHLKNAYSIEEDEAEQFVDECFQNNPQFTLKKRLSVNK